MIKLNYKKILVQIFTLLSLVFVACLIYLFTPPNNFPADELIFVQPGSSIAEIANNLEQRGVVRSGKLFQIHMTAFSLIPRAGDYKFQSAGTMYEIARRISRGEYGDVIVSVTIPPGTTFEGIKNILEQEEELLNFDAEIFQVFADRIGEGKFFPDTYHFFPSTVTTEILNTMHEQWQEKVEETLNLKLARINPDIFIIASLIEREAGRKSADEAGIISGIIKNRLDIGMKLQLDATLYYLTERTSAELRKSDLNLDSPYNTYRHTGLPPTPISNYSTKSLQAAQNPTQTEYLFYLHDPDGNVHYARTNAEHVQNKKLYLK